MWIWPHISVVRNVINSSWGQLVWSQCSSLCDVNLIWHIGIALHTTVVVIVSYQVWVMYAPRHIDESSDNTAFDYFSYDRALWRGRGTTWYFVLTSTMCVLCIMGALCSASSFSTLFTYVPGTGVCNATSYFVPGTNYPHTLQRNIWHHYPYYMMLIGSERDDVQMDLWQYFCYNPKYSCDSRAPLGVPEVSGWRHARPTQQPSVMPA